MISVVVPAIDEADEIAACVASARDPAVDEIIVVDGGSRDGTVEVATAAGARVVTSAPGRSRQLNAGAALARSPVFLFLHADTRLPPDFADPVMGAIRGGAVGGRFDVWIRGRHPGFPLLSRAINARSRATGVATGDQAIFASADVFRSLGGFPAIPLMEDVAFSRALRSAGRIEALDQRVSTSGRRWEEHGFLRTILLMWALRLGYALGVSPELLARRYRRHRPAGRR